MFDNSTMDTGDQMRAREAAAKFIDANAAPNRLIAVVDFGGTIRHCAELYRRRGSLEAGRRRTENVGSFAKRCRRWRLRLLARLCPSPMGAAPLGMPYLGNAEADFGARSVLLALRSLAKSLGTVPGRKTLVMLTSGFPVTPEIQSELTAVISVCNRYNVAVYPLDVRGLVARHHCSALKARSCNFRRIPDPAS